MEAQMELTVVGYYNGKAIITGKEGQVYYLKCASNEAPIGTVIEPQRVNPITSLGQEEYKRIIALFPEKAPEGWKQSGQITLDDFVDKLKEGAWRAGKTAYANKYLSEAETTTAFNEFHSYVEDAANVLQMNEKEFEALAIWASETPYFKREEYNKEFVEDIKKGVKQICQEEQQYESYTGQITGKYAISEDHVKNLLTWAAEKTAWKDDKVAVREDPVKECMKRTADRTPVFSIDQNRGIDR